MANETILYVIVILAVIAFIGLITFSAGGWRGIGWHIKNTTSNNTISITASGTASNASTQASMYVDINGTGLTNQQAVQNITATLNTFNSTIYKYVNGNLSMITTQSFQVYKLYNKTGYQATENLVVTIPRIGNVSNVILALSAIPNVYVTYATPKLSDAQTTSLRLQALSAALSNATAQAYAVIGKNNTIYSTNITVNGYNFYPYPYGVSNVAGAKSITPAQISPQFYGGTGQVTESITAVFTYGKKH